MNNSPLPRTNSAEQGVSAQAIARFVKAVEEQLTYIHSFMLLRRGNVIAEGWWYPYRPETPHMLFSLSKSFTSTAVGLAIAEGRLTLDDPVLGFFTNDAPRRISANLAAMKVRHLLSMSTGHAVDSTERTMRGRNPYKAFLSMPVKHKPGTFFVYNSGASFMLAAIVQKLTGQTLVEYLAPRLFEPLGIVTPYWERHPNGVNFGGWGLNLKTEDIARFGQLYLQQGQWNGAQLIPADWVASASASHVSNGSDPNSDWAQGYGFQFWRCRHNCYRGDGAFGQYCVIMPEQQAVLVITSGLGDMQPPLNLVWEHLLPALNENSPVEPTTPAQDGRFVTLSLPMPKGANDSPLRSQVSGQRFLFEANPPGMKSVQVDFGTEACTLQVLDGRGTHSLTCGYGIWLEGKSTLGSPDYPFEVASGTWVSPDTFEITVIGYQTPFTATLSLHFDGETLVYQSRMNVNFGPTEFPPITGRRIA